VVLFVWVASFVGDILILVVVTISCLISSCITPLLMLHDNVVIATVIIAIIAVIIY